MADYKPTFMTTTATELSGTLRAMTSELTGCDIFTTSTGRMTTTPLDFVPSL